MRCFNITQSQLRVKSNMLNEIKAKFYAVNITDGENEDANDELLVPPKNR